MLKRQRKFESGKGGGNNRSKGNAMNSGGAQRGQSKHKQKQNRLQAKRRYDQLMAHMGLTTGSGGSGAQAPVAGGRSRNGGHAYQHTNRARAGRPDDSDTAAPAGAA